MMREVHVPMACVQIPFHWITSEIPTRELKKKPSKLTNVNTTLCLQINGGNMSKLQQPLSELINALVQKNL